MVRYQFRKICDDFNISVPQNGYWQKLNYNKPVKKIALASADNEDKKIVLPAKRPENGETATHASGSGTERPKSSL